MGYGDWVKAVPMQEGEFHCVLGFTYAIMESYCDLITKPGPLYSTSGAIPYRFISAKRHKYMSLIVEVKDRGKALKL